MIQFSSFFTKLIKFAQNNSVVQPITYVLRTWHIGTPSVSVLERRHSSGDSRFIEREQWSVHIFRRLSCIQIAVRNSIAEFLTCALKADARTAVGLRAIYSSRDTLGAKGEKKKKKQTKRIDFYVSRRVMPFYTQVCVQCVRMNSSHEFGYRSPIAFSRRKNVYKLIFFRRL